MDKKRKNKGITLVSLVVMIVVLLILGGITISTLVGKNRNYNKSSRSKAKSRNSTNKRRNPIRHIKQADGIK